MTAYFTTRTDAAQHLVVPALGEHADYYDVDGLTDAVTRYVPGQGFTQTVTTSAAGAIDSGAFTATEDDAESFANLDAALTVWGYRREDVLSVEGDWSQYVVARVS